MNWGNHKNNSIEYKGRVASILSSRYLLAFGGQKEGKTNSNEMVVLTTGASKQTEKYHTFDVAGNLWEWTDEASLYKNKNENETNIQNRICRGGGNIYESNLYPVCYRVGGNSDNTASLDIGFRVVLYIK